MKRTAAIVILVSVACAGTRDSVVIAPPDIPASWADLTVYITKNTPANSPTYASRALGYIGLTMYETIVPGYPTHRSMVGQLTGLDSLPKIDPGLSYDWRVTLNAGQAVILKRMYNQTSDVNKQKIDSLEAHILAHLRDDIADQALVDRSVAYGHAVAETIFEWSKSDGGHRAYLSNFDKQFRKEPSPGSWEPPLYGQSFSHYPLHPRWGDNRCFVQANHDMPIPSMIRYTQDSLSEYYKEYQSVYEKSKVLTQEEKEAALWWGDDPSDTFTPPGHSYYLATLVIRKAKPDLIRCAETYARVGMAVADAFVNCWKWKYYYYSERPSSYITKNIDAHWESFWPDPPFPAFPSGHATQAAAVATVFIDLYGENFEFTDDAHAGRPKDELRKVEFKPRSFKTFWSVAEETANSRFYGGIHSTQDNAVGLREGAAIGRNVNALTWKNESVYANANQ